MRNVPVSSIRIVDDREKSVFVTCKITQKLLTACSQICANNGGKWKQSLYEIFRLVSLHEVQSLEKSLPENKRWVILITWTIETWLCLILTMTLSDGKHYYMHFAKEVITAHEKHFTSNIRVLLRVPPGHHWPPGWLFRFPFPAWLPPAHCPLLNFNTDSRVHKCILIRLKVRIFF